MLIFSLLLLFMGNSVSASSLCSVYYNDPNFSVVQMGTRQVDVVGWEHPSVEDYEALRIGYEHALDQAKRNECAKAERSLRKAIKNVDQTAQQSASLYSQLEKINRIKTIDLIGKEISPEEWSEALRAYDFLESDFKEMERICGSPMGEALKEIRLIAYGPELVFSREYKNTDLKGIESQKARLKNMKSMAAPVMEEFDAAENPHQVLPGYRELETSLWMQTTPPESAIKLFARNLSPLPRTELKVRRDLKRWQIIVRDAYARDDEIVKNVERDTTTTHLTIVMGFRHVRDLTDKLVQACEVKEASTR